MVAHNIFIVLLFFSSWVCAQKDGYTNTAAFCSTAPEKKLGPNGLPQITGFYCVISPKNNGTALMHKSGAPYIPSPHMRLPHAGSAEVRYRDLVSKKLSKAELNTYVSHYYDASIDAIVAFNPLYLTHEPHACAPWSVQAYCESMVKIFGYSFPIDLDVDVPPEYKCFARNRTSKVYVHDGHRHLIAQQWPLYDHPMFWEFLRQYPDYEHCILAAQNLIDKDESVCKQVSARAKEQIAAEAQRIIAYHQAAHARAIQERYERESEAQLAASTQQEAANEMLLHMGREKRKKLQQFEMMHDQLCTQYNNLDAECCNKNRLHHMRNESVALERVINGDDATEYAIRQLNDNAIALLQNCDIDIQEFTHCFGNAIVIQKHEEIIDIANAFGDLSIQSKWYTISSIMCDFASCAQTCNKSGEAKEAFTITSFCWDVLECVQAVVGGGWDGVKAIGRSMWTLATKPGPTIAHAFSAFKRAALFIEDIILHEEYFADEREVQILSQFVGVTHNYPKEELEAYTDKLVRAGDVLEAAGHRLNNELSKMSVSQKLRLCTSLGVELCLTPVVYDKLFASAGLLCKQITPHIQKALQGLPNAAPMEHLLMCAEGGAEIEVGISATRAMERAAETESKIPTIAGGGNKVGNFISEETAYTLLEKSQELRELEKVVERLKQITDKNIFKTSYVDAISVKQFEAIQARAKALYSSIREAIGDISKVSENTGLPQKIIQQIKDHVFFDEHILFDGIKRFDPTLDIAEVWVRLVDNKFVQADLTWLLHEYAESILMKGQRMDWRNAHDIINQFYNWEKLIK